MKRVYTKKTGTDKECSVADDEPGLFSSIIINKTVPRPESLSGILSSRMHITPTYRTQFPSGNAQLSFLTPKSAIASLASRFYFIS